MNSLDAVHLASVSAECGSVAAQVVASVLLGAPANEPSAWLRKAAAAILAALPTSKLAVTCSVACAGQPPVQGHASRDSSFNPSTTPAASPDRAARAASPLPGVAASEFLIHIDAADAAALPARAAPLAAALAPALAHGYADQVLLPAQRRNALLERVSPSQRHILPMLVEGKTEREIASAIHRSPHTVHDHVKTIYSTLGIASRYELLALWGEPSTAPAHR